MWLEIDHYRRSIHYIVRLKTEEDIIHLEQLLAPGTRLWECRLTVLKEDEVRQILKDETLRGVKVDDDMRVTYIKL